jgi:hypothetical protein
MTAEVAIRIILVDPPAGVDFGVQRGRGAKYETLQVQRRTRGDIVFDLSLTVNDSRKDGPPNFTQQRFRAKEKTAARLARRSDCLGIGKW